jgi:hypothetical protein
MRICNLPHSLNRVFLFQELKHPSILRCENLWRSSKEGFLYKFPKELKLDQQRKQIASGLFSSLGERVVGSHFLDLFAGTGSYGLEALSRGAKQGEFVENHRKQ